jgi:hypothetical protein
MRLARSRSAYAKGYRSHLARGIPRLFHSPPLLCTLPDPSQEYGTRLYHHNGSLKEPEYDLFVLNQFLGLTAR